MSYWVRRGGLVESPLRSSIAFELLRNSDPSGVGTGGNSRSPVGLFKYSGGSMYCLGLIGGSNRACVKLRGWCGVGRHKTNSTEFHIGLLYILCPTRTECVFLTPTVDTYGNNVPECVVEFLLQEKRSVE